MVQVREIEGGRRVLVVDGRGGLECGVTEGAVSLELSPANFLRQELGPQAGLYLPPQPTSTRRRSALEAPQHPQVSCGHWRTAAPLACPPTGWSAQNRTTTPLTVPACVQWVPTSRVPCCSRAPGLQGSRAPGLPGSALSPCTRPAAEI